ncbi:MAG TPA: amidase [Candidatus Rhabdochlamydia sp.]|nr:amidase [Candidatus Rhabdochlamydia sp.]
MLNQTLVQLCRAIKEKRLSAYELVSFYCERIKGVNPQINAVVQFNEERALQKAKRADQLLAKGSVGPLHGIPFTAKDWLETKDFISAAGMEERRGFLPSKNATVINRLEQAGAILLGKTNVPYHRIETDNPVYGRTCNPYDLAYSPGGSSGGEAAIIAAGGTAFGIGSDSGGSIRLPCHFCGIAGLKPTTGRIPATGHYPEIGGFIDPRSQIGPMARFVDDLEVLYPILSGSDGIDPYVVDAPNFQAPPLCSLKIAYYINHTHICPSADTAWRLEESISYLSKQVKSIAHQQPKCLDSVLGITYGYWNLYRDPPTTKEYLKLLKDWDKFRQLMWEFVQPYDVMITPVCTQSAHLYGDTPPESFPYTLTYSLLGWPCVVVRVGTSDKGFPINVQVIAKPFHEEICFLVAKQLEKLCGWQEPKLDF